MVVNLIRLIRPVSYLLILAFMLCLEWRIPFVRSQQKKFSRFTFHFGLSVCNTSFLYIILAGPIYSVLAFTGNHKLGLSAFLGLSGFTEIVATVIAFDCWDYWMHLVNHKIGFLWRFHKAHHSDMELDVTTALRFHIGELLISGGAKCAMILIWGPSLWGLVIFETLLSSASEFHHSNVNIPLGVQDLLEKIIVTPRMHRCHHALHRNCFNTNYSTTLSIWDRLFRTYHWANPASEFERIGLFKLRGPDTMRLKPFLLTPLKKES